jgi:diguanylate cyclase (GGDEF)-like protein/PAS domain S-box-containing protein
MKDREKTKEQLIKELNELRQRFEKLKKEETHRQNAEQTLVDSEEKYRSLVESTDDSIYLVDNEHRYLFMNKKHIMRLGIPGEEYEGRSYSDFHTPDETRFFMDKIDRVFEVGESSQSEYQSKRDGRHFFQTFSPVLAIDGSVAWVTIVSKDVTRLKELEDQQRTLSITDGMTGLYNRRGFETLANMQCNIAHRLGQRLYLLYADLDGLKKINDTFGHQEGDRAIIEVAKILDLNYRRSDIVARIGGDEFLIFPVGSCDDDVDTIRKRLQQVLNNYNEQSELKYKISLSIGIACYDPEHPCSIDELLDQADRFMYEEKKQKNK